jgi:hypothetical protein
MHPLWSDGRERIRYDEHKTTEMYAVTVSDAWVASGRWVLATSHLERCGVTDVEGNIHEGAEASCSSWARSNAISSAVHSMGYVRQWVNQHRHAQLSVLIDEPAYDMGRTCYREG